MSGVTSGPTMWVGARGGERGGEWGDEWGDEWIYDVSQG